MDIDEAASLLRRMYDGAGKNLKATSVHLFGIKNSTLLFGLSSKKIAEQAGISQSYYSEIDKGKHLGKYVSINSNDSIRLLQPDEQIQATAVAGILRDVYKNADHGKKVVSIHLFGIKYAAALDGVSISEVCNEAHLRLSYATEIRKSVRLASFVTIDKLPERWPSSSPDSAHPDTKPFPRIEHEIPEYIGSHPFSKTAHQHHTPEDLRANSRGNKARTEFFVILRVFESPNILLTFCVGWILYWS